MINNPWRFCVAPMLDWTTSECRTLHRQMSSHARLYTEMVTTGAIIYGDAERHLSYHYCEHPVALQLGGGNPDALAQAVEIAQQYHYDEINLNVGCPSNRVQNNQIGACLMDNAKLVARCLMAMQEKSDVPISVKHRLAIDHQDERQVFDFIDCITHESECRIFIVHARKAWLSGLSPKENRDIPPLNYELVYEIKQRFPALTIVLNGGIDNLSACNEHLQYVDGVMLGRAAYQQPRILLGADIFYGGEEKKLAEVLPLLRAQMEQGIENGQPLWHYTRHLLGLFNGYAGAKKYRRFLSEQTRNINANIQAWDDAVSFLVF